MTRRAFLAALCIVGLRPAIKGGAQASSAFRRAQLQPAGAYPIALPQADPSDANTPPAAKRRTGMGIGESSFAQAKPADEFLEYCYSFGAGGVQVELTDLEPDFTRKLRQRAEELGMYLEVSASLPRKDTSLFERTVKAAREAGALCLRTACLDGRRYEEFSKLDEWKSFVAESRARIARALPILEKHRMPMGIENHKDWTAEELLALLKEFSSEYLGACVDTGNNIALLDDPAELVERLAPFAVNTHIKDMAVEEYAEGFLLAEVPLGQGMLDMKRIIETIARAHPRTRFTLEMITRNPLRVPCLTQKYWTTFPDRNGRFLASTLSLVRSHSPRRPLPRLDALDPAARLRLEEDNVKQCLAYARDELGLLVG